MVTSANLDVQQPTAGCHMDQTVAKLQGCIPADHGFHDRYKIGERIGGGAFGTVYLVHRRGVGKMRAVKVVPIERASCTEQYAWARVGQHRNIVSLLNSYVDSNFQYFVMELCNMTLLQAWWYEQELSEYSYANYFNDMASALAHIHSLGVVHRDVKHTNFLIGGSSGRTVKLCDFGLAAVACSTGFERVCGTASYLAPEVVTPNQTYGAAADLWSLGVIAYMAFFGSWPYPPKGKTSGARREAIREGTVPECLQASEESPQEAVSDQAFDFVRALLNRNPEERPSAEKSLNMDYLLNKEQRAMEAAMARGRRKTYTQMLHETIKLGVFSQCQTEEQTSYVSLIQDLQNAAQTKLAANCACPSCTKAAARSAGNPTPQRSIIRL